jgi:phosphoribulokinase
MTVDPKVLAEAKAAWEHDPNSKKFRDVLARNNVSDEVEGDGMHTHDRLEMEWIIEQRQASRRGGR